MTQMDVIFGKPGDLATDPVCKMKVDPANPPGGSFEYQGETYYFCAPGCRGAFSSDPERFLSGGAVEHHHMGGDHEGHGHH